MDQRNLALFNEKGFDFASQISIDCMRRLSTILKEPIQFGHIFEAFLGGCNLAVNMFPQGKMANISSQKGVEFCISEFLADGYDVELIMGNLFKDQIPTRFHFDKFSEKIEFPWNGGKRSLELPLGTWRVALATKNEETVLCAWIWRNFGDKEAPEGNSKAWALICPDLLADLIGFFFIPEEWKERILNGKINYPMGPGGDYSSRDFTGYFKNPEI
jgi:hypothetical protein